MVYTNTSTKPGSFHIHTYNKPDANMVIIITFKLEYIYIVHYCFYLSQNTCVLKSAFCFVSQSGTFHGLSIGKTTMNLLSQVRIAALAQTAILSPSSLNRSTTKYSKLKIQNKMGELNLSFTNATYLVHINSFNVSINHSSMCMILPS